MEKHFKKPWRCAELLFKFCDTPSGHGSTRPTKIAQVEVRPAAPGGAAGPARPRPPARLRRGGAGPDA